MMDVEPQQHPTTLRNIEHMHNPKAVVMTFGDTASSTIWHM